MTCKIEQDNVVLRKRVRVLEKAIRKLKDIVREMLVSAKGD